MRKVSPMGLSIAKILGTLLILEAGLFAAGKLIARGSGIISPPREVGDWIVSAGDPPVSDIQRDSPSQTSVLYTNGDETAVHFDVASVQSVNCLRLPEKYMVDCDGRINPYQTQVLQHRNRNAFSVSIISGIEKTVFAIHWYQKPGWPPVPMAAESVVDITKALFLRRPKLYVCDAWVEYLPTDNLAKEKLVLQRFADTLSDKIKTGN